MHIEFESSRAMSQLEKQKRSFGSYNYIYLTETVLFLPCS